MRRLPLHRGHVLRFLSSWRFFVFVLLLLAIGSTILLYNTAEVEYLEYQPFGNSNGKNWREQVLEVPTVLTLMGVPYGSSILEIGTGRGVALPTISLMRQPQRLVGLDISQEALDIARESLRKDSWSASVELVRGDARALPFANSSFDVLLDFGTLYHISNQAAALREIARVVRPGGMIVTETPFAQFTSHPWRSWGRKVPWDTVPCLRRTAWWLMWEKRVNECW